MRQGVREVYSHVPAGPCWSIAYLACVPFPNDRNQIACDMLAMLPSAELTTRSYERKPI